MKCLIVSEKKWNADLSQNLSHRKPEITWGIINKRSDFNHEYLTRYKPDYIFIPHWSYMIPENIYNQFDCILFHMTDLPYGRGGSPLQNLILEGRKGTKISALKVTKEVDAGPIYLKKGLSLSGSAEEIFFRANEVIESMIIEIIDSRLTPKPQEIGSFKTYKRRTPDMSEITEEMDLERIYDQIRMLDADGYPHAFLKTKNCRFEFTGAKLEKGEYLTAHVKIIPLDKKRTI